MTSDLQQRFQAAAERFPRLLHVLIEWPIGTDKPVLSRKLSSIAESDLGSWADTYKAGWNSEHWLLRDVRET